MTESIGQRSSVSGTSPMDVPPKHVRRRREGRVGFGSLRKEDVDADARRLCTVVLEVLSGVRTPTDAATALSVSVPRYGALCT